MNPIDNNLASVVDQLGLSGNKDTQKPNDFGQNEFLTLMITQLKNQNPMQPMQDGQFLSQMAQFSSAAGMQKLQDSFTNLASTLQSNQALQASSLVGRKVLISSDQGQLPVGGNLSGVVDMTQATGNLTVNILNQNGELVRHLELGAQSAGQVKFNWDGLNDSGQPQPPGNYSISAEAQVDGVAHNYETLVEASVDSVTIGKQGQGLSLNLSQFGSVGLDQIRQIL